MSDVLSAKEQKADDTGVAKVPELERLKLHNLVLQQQMWREQLHVMSLQSQALQTRIDTVVEQINALTERIFADAQLDAQSYQLNIDNGTFVVRTKRP
jgi:GTP-dependent phosphoenolpyruvate carboxykinase